MEKRDEIRRIQGDEERTYGIIGKINDIDHPVDDSRLLLFSRVF